MGLSIAANQSGTKNAENKQAEPWSLRDVEGRTLMVDIRHANGNRFALPYAYLTKVDYNLSDGITLRYASSCITIRGRHLQELYEGFLTQRVLWLQEENDLLTPKPESEPCIVEVVLSDRFGPYQ